MYWTRSPLKSLAAAQHRRYGFRGRGCRSGPQKEWIHNGEAMNVMESEPADARTITSAMPLNVAGRDALIVASLQDDMVSATGPGYAVTWQLEHC